MRAPLLALALLLGTGCVYNDHVNMGMTEKWVNSDVNYVTKIGGTALTSLGDSLIGPLTMIVDTSVPVSQRYHPDHQYLSYASSRTIVRSEMSTGYQWISAIPALVLDTLYLPGTGLIDLINVLAMGDTSASAEPMSGPMTGPMASY